MMIASCGRKDSGATGRWVLLDRLPVVLLLLQRRSTFSASSLETTQCFPSVIVVIILGLIKPFILNNLVIRILQNTLSIGTLPNMHPNSL
jgi:hypothetical protein